MDRRTKALVPVTLGALALGLALAASSPVAASGGGGGGGGGSGGGGGGGGASEAEDMTTCPRGEVWEKKRHRCIKAHGGALPDDALADYAYALAKAERYDEALDVLGLLDNPQTPEALNYRGYATRKLGRTEEGIGYYLQAIALDPKYTLVREYLGEAYVLQGRTDLARDQLQTIETLCGTGCEPYEDLADAIAHASKM